MNEKVLIIDDEESLRFTFRSFLRDEGYDVTTAENYDDAMKKMSNTEFEVIFADIILGDKTGIDILREVGSRGLNCPVIMFTGDPNVKTASEAVRLGAFDYLAKPVQQEELLRIARLALNQKTLFEEKERYRTHLEAIFSSVDEGIVTVNNDMKITEINAAASDLCGISRISALGTDFTRLPLSCNGQCRKLLVETIAKKESIQENRLECVLRDRSKKIISMKTLPLVEKGEQTGAILIIRDDTRLDYLEKDLNQRQTFRNIVGESEAMQRIYSLIEILSNVDSTVLIVGETGTGKELVAEAIHYKGKRSREPLVKVNCSALPENLLESELFGHVKGAFTGAMTDKTGRFEKADGGTIFLDEIGEVSNNVQLRLLRVLQEKTFERVGDSDTISIDVRIIAATNRKLKEKVARGEFREDLYYRLNVVEIEVPPIKHRKEDIPLLVEHFIKKYNDKFGKDIRKVSNDVMKVFIRYDWPGNVRELEHVIEHAFILCNEPNIDIEHLPEQVSGLYLSRSLGGSADAEKEVNRISDALKKSKWNKAKAASLLGISRQTLYRKIKDLGLKEEQ